MAASALIRAAAFTGAAAPLRTLICHHTRLIVPNDNNNNNRRHSFFAVSPSAVRALATEASSGKKMVLVTGATGRVGKEVVARLSKEEAFIVRAATRDKAAYATSLGAHETVTFDLEDKATWGPAMEGVTHLFSSTQDKYIAQHMEFAKWLGETPS